MTKQKILGYSTPMRRWVIKDTKTIRRRVYEHLREQLLNGEIPPRQHLIEAKIANELGTSRTPVREALHSLELEGLIESIPRVGYMVKPISEQEVEEICEIRMAIEGVAARWAMEKAHKKLIEELKNNIFISDFKLSKRDAKAFIDLDARFHEIIARHSGSQRLLELAQTLRRHMLRYRIQSIYSVDNVLRAIDGHKGIVRAIEKYDLGKVKMAIRKHMEQVKKDVLRYAFKETVKGKR